MNSDLYKAAKAFAVSNNILLGWAGIVSWYVTVFVIVMSKHTLMPLGGYSTWGLPLGK